jgi:hypothetical protein
VRCRDATASSFVTKVRGEVFAHFHAVAIKRHSSVWNWLFSLPGRILCEQSAWCQRKWWTCSWLCSSPVAFFRSALNRICHLNTCVRLMLSSPNAYLVIGRVSVAFFPRFAQNLMLFLYRIHREIASGQIHDYK